MQNKIKFNEPYLTGNELKYIEDVFNQKQFYGVGKYTEKCQSLISDKVGANKVLLTDSCTSALEITALLLKNYDKSEVILPSYTFTSTASAFVRAGFKLVFAEVDPKTLMLDVNDVKNKLTENTCAVITVHYGGYPSEVFKLKSICDENSVFLVEDAAQAFGSFLNREALGTIGDFGCFSFHETKNLHGGLSGALIIKNEKFFDRATHIWERGTNRQEVLKGVVDKYSWVEVGGSFYPTEMQAAFLYAQLEMFDENTRQRKALFEEYALQLGPFRELGFLHFNDYPENYISNYHAFYILLNSEQECDEFRVYLNENGISAYIGYVPLHSSKVGLSLGNKVDDLPITEALSKQILRLPFHNNLSVEDIKYIGSKVAEYTGK